MVMLVLGDAGDCRAGLALAAGAEQQHLVGRQVTELLLVQQAAGILQHAAGARGFDGVAHGAAGDHHLAAARPGGADGGGYAVEVRGKGGDGDAASGFADDPHNGFGNLRLGWRETFAQHIGRIAHQHVDAVGADGAEAFLVHARSQNRRAVDLPVAGMQHRALLRLDEKRRGFGNGVGDGNEFAGEGANREARPQGHDLHRHFFVEARFLQFQRQDLRGERRAVDRAFELRPQPGHRAQMIFMRMGEDEAVQVSLVAGDETHIRQYHVDARVGFLAELHAQIDHQPLPVVGWACAITIAVHADLAGAAQGQEDEVVAVAGFLFGVHRAICLMRSSSANCTSPE